MYFLFILLISFTKMGVDLPTCDFIYVCLYMNFHPSLPFVLCFCDIHHMVHLICSCDALELISGCAGMEAMSQGCCIQVLSSFPAPGSERTATLMAYTTALIVEVMATLLLPTSAPPYRAC